MSDPANPAAGSDEQLEAVRTPQEAAAHQATQQATQQAKRHRKLLDNAAVLPAITLSVFVCWLGSTVFVGSHSTLAAELSASSASVIFALASYSVALIAIAVVGGRLGDIIGRKYMFVGAGITFTLAAASAPLVDDVWELLAMRAVMGLCAGLILTSTGGVLASTLHGDTRHNAWLLWRGAGMTGMILGPVLGPVVSGAQDWRAPVLASAALMLVAVALGAIGMRNSRDDESHLTIGLIGPAALLGLGLLLPYLLLVLVKDQLVNWFVVVALLLLSVACLTGFIELNRRANSQLFDHDIVLGNSRLWVTDLFGAIHVGGLFIVFAALATVLDAGTTLTSIQVGLGMVALAIPLITLHLLAHRIRNRYGFTRQQESMVGSLLLVLSMCWLFLVALDELTYLTILPTLILAGAGFGLIRLLGHMGVIKTTGQRWASTLFGTRTFANHLGATVGAVLLGIVLAQMAASASQVDAQLARQAAIVAAWAVGVVVVCTAAFAALKFKLLGWEDPHWHPAGAAPDTATNEAPPRP